MKNVKGQISLELMIGISLVILLLVVQIPSFYHFYQLRSLESQTYQLMQDIEMVRTMALEKREKLSMEFYGSANYYRFEKDQGGMTDKNKHIIRTFSGYIGFPVFFGITPISYTSNDESGVISVGAINFGNNSMENYGVLSFNSLGIPSSGGHIVIVSKKIKKGLVVIIKPVTGRSRIGNVILNAPNWH